MVGFRGPIPLALLVVAHMGSLPGWLYSPAVFLGRYYTALAFSAFWVLQWTFVFISTASHTAFLKAPCLTFLTFLWKLEGCFADFITPEFCIPVKPASHEQCQDMLSAEAVARLLWNMVAAAWVPGWLSRVKWILENQFPSRLFSKYSYRNYQMKHWQLYTLEPVMDGACWFLDCMQGLFLFSFFSFFYFPHEQYLLASNDANLFSNHMSFDHNFYLVLFWSKLSSSNFLLCFLLLFLAINSLNVPFALKFLLPYKLFNCP